MTTALQIIPTAEIEAQTAIWPLRAAELEVVDYDSEQEAARLLQDIKALMAEIDAKCDPVVKAAHAAHKAAVAQKKDLQKDLVAADAQIRRKMGTYRLECEKRAREEAARREAEARKAREAAEKEAAELAKAGEQELAEAVREEAEVAAVPARVEEPPKVEGAGYRDNWKAEVTDFPALVKAVAAGEASIALLQPNTKVLGQQARSLKSEFKVPGVRVWNDKGVAVR